MIGEEIRQANFGEDRWRPLVSLIVGGKTEDDHHIKALDETVKIGQRKLYKSLSKNDIVEAVKEFGNPKKAAVKLKSRNKTTNQDEEDREADDLHDFHERKHVKDFLEMDKKPI